MTQVHWQSLIGMTLVLALALAQVVAPLPVRAEGERLPIGEFYATRMPKPPVIDGKNEPGEWDHAMAASGLIAPFDRTLQQVETTVYFGFDDQNFYFLFHCIRGNKEWKLWKGAREDDAYDFADPSLEVWITPPTPVPETYQNIINTYPAIFKEKFIPSRGYQAHGWKGEWKVAETESDHDYIIEGSIPIKDFGLPAVKNGDVWRFLLARNSPGTLPRSQAAWSSTEGFSEIPQHPRIHLMDDSSVLQMLGIISIFTGKYDFPMAVTAPAGQGDEVTVELRFHKNIAYGADDRVEKKTFTLAAGEHKTFDFTGDVTDMKKGYFSVTATRKDGAVIYQQNLPFEVNGFTPQVPSRPDFVPPPQPLGVQAMYGPESNTLIAKADIIDLPGKERAVGGSVRVLDEATGRVLKEATLGAFRYDYSTANIKLDGVPVPVEDTAPVVAALQQIDAVKKENAGRVKQGQPALPLPALPAFTPLPVKVEVTVFDKDKQPLAAQTTVVQLKRYKFNWQDNNIGVTDSVIPPWTPVKFAGGRCEVWNRALQLDGLGLCDRLDNGGVSQLKSMRLVAIKDGKPVEIAASQPSVEKKTDAAITLSGSGEGAGLKLSARTRVEFDGFVLSDLTIAPLDAASPAKIDGLYLEVTLPESEATHFCTTSGGWAAIHDETPAYWSSQTTANGMLHSSFVPYVWLTNSDRGFIWFADNDKGWVTDDSKAQPMQEIFRRNGEVTLRIHFIALPTELTAATTVQYGYQSFPSRPLPPGWRSIICTGNADDAGLPGARNNYFWTEADWAVDWPYYCSPYPWSMATSKTFFDPIPKDSTFRPCVGSIAHAIGRYRDYDGIEFPEYAVDWGIQPGDAGDGNVTMSKGPNDFRLFHYQRWVREAGFRGLYIDENYLGLDENYLTGGAYLRPDGQLQRGYTYIGMRDYFKRMMTMFYQNNVPRPNLWQHISSGAAYYSWFGDVYFDGENVEPTNLDADYIEVLPAGRMRAIGSAKCAGGVMTMMCQSQRHPTPWEAKHTHQFVGWVMAHDILPEQVTFYNTIAQEARFYADDVDFIGYWKPTCPAKTTAKDCLVSVHKQKTRAILWIVNTARQDQQVPVTVNFKALGFDPARTVAMDAETGDLIKLTRTGFSVPVLQRDFVAVHLVARQGLKDGETFAATFAKGTTADEALGCDLFQSLRGRPLTRVDDGQNGKALDATDGVQIWSHLQLADAEGRVTFRMLLDDRSAGTLFSAGPLHLDLSQGNAAQITLACAGQKAEAPAPAPGWHAFEVAWKDGKARLSMDGQPIGEIACATVGIPRGTGPAMARAARLVFRAHAVTDIHCYRPMP